MKFRILLVAMVGLLLVACGGSSPAPAPAESAPTISAIPDQVTNANETSASIPFTVSNALNLSFSVSSDNQQVVPNSGIEIVINGNDGTLTVAPVVDTLGDAFITIVVTDQAGLSASTSFLVTVVPQQLSLKHFVRNQFALSKDGDPAPINAVMFDQDADTDDFADLLAP